MHPRLKVSLAAGFDPDRLGLDLWQQLAKTNLRFRCCTAPPAGRCGSSTSTTLRARSISTDDRLAHEVHRIARFFQPAADKMIEVPAPSQLIANMLATPVRHIPLPLLRGIASAPFVGPDGEADHRRWIPPDGGDVP